MGDDHIPPDWGTHVGEELRKSYERYRSNGFFDNYLSGTKILDIGYKGYIGDATPLFPHAIGIDLDYPGYDGKRLPFPDGSQDAVFSSHTLEHVPDYRATIRDWFRVLRVGGFLVLIVPHQFLYERKRSLPSRWNADHRRFYTAASLLGEVEEALDPMSYRVRYLEENDTGFDYSIPPDHHGGGCYEIVLVVERILRPDYADDVLHPRPSVPEMGVFRSQIAPVLGQEEPVIAIDGESPGFADILVLKLDHRGDFIMAKAALMELRRRFPECRLSLACGPWNTQAAEEMAIFDEIIGFEFFDESGPKILDTREKISAEFASIMHGRTFDLAMDLRIDEDTRDLLSFVAARHRAGFGRTERFPFLDIALPFANPTFTGRARRFLLRADRFVTRIGEHRGFWIGCERRAEQRAAGELLIFGPYERFEAGRYELELVMEPVKRDVEIAYDICSDQGRNVMAMGQLTVVRGRRCVVAFELEEFVKDLEIRMLAPRSGKVQPFRFDGWQVSRSGVLQGPHQEEMQALLVHLVAMRARHPYSINNVRS